ncbi:MULTISPECIES: ABC transporter permease [unclassified Pseudoalteromonas]|uniref:ABC transporter permease n=1 Tax=unclassified Pseudoalteromonas TaxID=194690 RepID=UPI0015F941B2|nr:MULTISPECIES: ABC transporter permease [unclassified Pseudoalteromonas]MBB1329743.1 ABC transporter permease [Pseudoalteromonas sp. SR43-7]MBB1379119.1 ABC transporter permease [Pseudoalteromonas sp. SR43-2]
MELDVITNILYATIRTGTPLLLVALGEMVCEKSGTLNLGQEGMMLLGAVAGFITMYQCDNLFIGFTVAALVGVMASLIFAFVALNLNASQVAAGLALTIFGTGLSAFLGADYEGKTINALPTLAIAGFEHIPVLGKALFSQDAIVYLSWGLVLGAYLFFKYHRAGLAVRAIGENPSVGNNLGLPVMRTRYLAVMFGGALAGIAGAYLSLAYTPLWTQNMTAGRGWIALALVVFASWRIERVILGAYLFGFASIMHLVAQAFGWAVESNLLAMLPYGATLIVLIMLSKNKQKLKMYEPMWLGKPWHKGH